MPEPQDPSQLGAIIGAEVGAYMSQAVTSNMTVGLGWGKTLSASLPSIEYREPQGVSVMSMLGGLTRVSGVNPSEFAWRLAARPVPGQPLLPGRRLPAPLPCLAGRSTGNKTVSVTVTKLP